MQKQDVDQNPKNRVNKRQPWKVGLGLFGVALLVSLALGSAAIAHSALAPLVPKMPNRPEAFTARLGWYLQEGQIKHDVRTLAAVFRYLMEPESDTPTVTNVANLPVAERTAARPPES